MSHKLKPKKKKTLTHEVQSEAKGKKKMGNNNNKNSKSIQYTTLSINKKGLPLGVSLKHLLNLQDVNENHHVYEVKEILMNKLSKKKISYANYLEKKEPTAVSTKILSYVCYPAGLRWRDMIRFLTEQMDISSYVWIDIVCMNHFVHLEFDEYYQDLCSLPSTIRNISVMMNPWQKPEVFKRSWCLMEMFVFAEKLSDVWFCGLYGYDQEEMILKMKLGHVNAEFLKHLFDSINAEKSESMTPSFQLKISKIIKERQEVVHNCVSDTARKYLFAWYEGVILKALEMYEETDERKANMYETLGFLYWQYGRRQDAIKAFKEGLLISKETFPRNDTNVIRRLKQVADYLREVQEFEEAESCIKEVIDIEFNTNKQKRKEALAKRPSNLGANSS